jgi:hypothetical protein
MFVYKRKILYYSSFQVGVIIFGSVRFLSKKITKPKFFFKKNRNQFKPTGFGSVQFLGQKPVFPVWFGFGSVFSVWFFQF